MAVERVESGKIYFPPKDPNRPDERDVMHPETDTDSVFLPNGEVLTDALTNGGMVISETKPTRSCLWGKITKKG